jgi:hypothetical protein
MVLTSDFRPDRISISNPDLMDNEHEEKWEVFLTSTKYPESKNGEVVSIASTPDRSDVSLPVIPKGMGNEIELAVRDFFGVLSNSTSMAVYQGPEPTKVQDINVKQIKKITDEDIDELSTELTEILEDLLPR